MAENNNASVAAVVIEVTEGTLVLPTAAGQYFPLREGFEMAPNIENLETDELRGSIAPAKPIRGLERPTSNIPMYLRHSGVEGQAPNWDEFLRSAFGSNSTNGTERSTTTGSTTTVVNLAAGGGDFARGKAVLSKHGSGYEIRPVHSVATNALTLGFPLDNAPGSGIAMGKCVNYAPANSAHPSFSLWNFRGDGGAIEAIAGAKAIEIEWSAQAGGFIEQNVSIQGTRFYYNPIDITSSTEVIDWEDDDGVFAASVTVKTYLTPHELAQAIEDAMNAAASTEVFTVTYQDADGKFKISGTGTLLTLKWNTGTNTASSIASKIGFSTAADSSGTAAATGYTGSALSWGKYHTPSYDSADALAAKGNEVYVGDGTTAVCICVQTITVRIANELQEIPCICEESGISGSVFRRRRVTWDVVGEMKRHDVSKFEAYRNNTEVRAMWAGGEKSGGNWVAGKCFCFYLAAGTVTAFQNGDEGGLVTCEFSLAGFADASGNGEFYLNFL